MTIIYSNLNSIFLTLMVKDIINKLIEILQKS